MILARAFQPKFIVNETETIIEGSKKKKCIAIVFIHFYRADRLKPAQLTVCLPTDRVIAFETPTKNTSLPCWICVYVCELIESAWKIQL